ncbi:MAG: hypothetical protein AAF597_05895 [Bacteroidota bacterium]
MSYDNQSWEEHWRDSLTNHSPTPLPADWEAMESLLTAGQQAPPDTTPEPGIGGGMSLWSWLVLTGLIALGLGLGYANWPHPATTLATLPISEKPRPLQDTIVLVNPHAKPDGLVIEAPADSYTKRVRYDTQYVVDAAGNMRITSIDTSVSFALPGVTMIDPKDADRPEVSTTGFTPIDNSLTHDISSLPVETKTAPAPSPGINKPLIPARRLRAIPPLPPAPLSIPSDRKLWQQRLDRLRSSPDFRARPVFRDNGYFPPVRSKFKPE